MPQWFCCSICLPGTEKAASLVLLLNSKACLVLRRKEGEADLSICVEDLVNHHQLIGPPITVSQGSPALVKLQPVPSTEVRAG
jgi:hypothetical protein